MERMGAGRLVDGFFVTRPLQEAALEVLSSPFWDRHVRSLGTALRERCAVLAAAVAQEIPAAALAGPPTGGVHLWIRLPPGVDDTVLTSAARQRGVSVSAGSRCFATGPPAAHLRIGFAATADHTELTEGARRLEPRSPTSTRRTRETHKEQPTTAQPRHSLVMRRGR